MVAPHGKAGLEMALAHRPALIFSDLMMPQMGGAELIRALRAELNTSAPPVILMTAADMRFAKDVGADSILKKPFELTVVDALLRQYLETP
jgi:CheY-like chemotaxis protein